jgi:hypothetical protein
MRIGERANVVLMLAAAALSARAQTSAPLAARLQVSRKSPSDLELAGDLKGVPRGVTRFLSREDLLAVSQEVTITPDDGNFKVATNVREVPLADLARALGVPASDVAIAICKDKYRAHYSRAYVATHHPVLALEVNGKALSDPPKSAEGEDPGPYLIAHVNFRPGFKILAHEDEPQIPWGVVRLEFQSEKTVFGAIVPPGDRSDKSPVEEGYKIARQNCFRCHNSVTEGGQKSGVTWAVLSALATNGPAFFAEYVQDPKSKSSNAQMPGNPKYDDKTLQALTAYFQSLWYAGQL